VKFSPADRAWLAALLHRCRTACCTIRGRATKHELRQFRHDINNHLRIRYRPQDGLSDPLLRWFH
jgi:hypothetical protein